MLKEPDRLVCEIEKKEKQEFLKKLKENGQSISFIIRQTVKDYINT